MEEKTLFYLGWWVKERGAGLAQLGTYIKAGVLAWNRYSLYGLPSVAEFLAFLSN